MSRVYLRRGSREIVATEAELGRDVLGAVVSLLVTVGTMAVCGWVLWGALTGGAL